MARMHSKRHGTSKSRKPIAQDIGEPKEFDRAAIEKVIIDYAKQGVPPAQIGELLKKEHNMPYVKHYMGKRLGAILKEKGVSGSIPPDLMGLMKKAVNTSAHLSKNKRDVNNNIRLKRIESKIWRLTKYYIRQGVLPPDWRYDIKRAELIVKRAM